MTSNEKAAPALESELRLYRSLVANSGEGIFRLDFDPHVATDLEPESQVDSMIRAGMVGAANDALARMYGFERGADLVGRPLASFLPADEPINRKSLLTFVRDGHRFHDVESVERDREGKRRVFLNSAIGVIEAGGLVAAWGSQREVTAEREALAALRDQERLFTTAFATNPSGLSISTLAEGRMEIVNDAFLEWLDRNREEVVGRSALELGLWADPTVRSRFVERLRRDGVVRQMPHVVTNRRGERIDLLLSARVIEVGGRPCILMSGENVTELGRAQRELADSERKLALIFRASPGALSLSRFVDSRFLDVNEAFASLVGLPREELIGRSSLELGLWPDPEERRRVFQPIVEQGFALRIPARVVAAGGEVREARVSGQMLEIDGEACLLILAEDVTELNRTQRALASSEARFRAAAEGSLDAFLLCEAECDASGAVVDFSVLEANERACRSLGRPREQVVGRKLGELLRGEEAATRVGRLREVFESGRAHDGEIRVASGGRRRRWLHQQAVPLERGVAEWTRDVTDRRAAEEESRRLEAEFHRGQRLESLGLLAGGVAHDFNNLLTGIVGYADVALRRLPEGAEARPPVQEILLAARRATELTQKMLAFAGGGPLEFAWTSLNVVVQEMVDLARPALPRERAVELRLGEPPPGLEADATQMRQVVLNLLLNASEAIPGAAGTIEVATGEVSCERERLATAVLGADLAEGRYAFVRVTDDGAGMTPEVRDRIFEPFFTTKFTGRGLGLAAVLGIVRAHLGAIEVDTEAARGTSITVLLPLAQPAAG